MSDLTIDQLVLDRTEYALMRDAERQRILPVRTLRRVQVGKILSLEFENADTLRYQVQQMVYVEGATSEASAAEQLSTYSRLLPTDHSVAATMFLALTDQVAVRENLASLTHIQEAISLQIGETSIAAEDVPPPDEVDTGRTFSVHFLRFRFDDAQRAALADLTTPAALRVDHPNYQGSTDLSAGLRGELIKDLGVLR
ncbi:MAG TPA: DUF3501 family protein [Jatrophihabitantaceae bacterium]|jgi:hypothetical protein|nr:DUF3501 family protein [Jatrophihabitantaceae bacterium]